MDNDALPRLQDVVRLPAAPHVVYQFALFPGECSKCAVVERHIHVEGHLGDPAEPRGRHDVVAQDEPRVAVELLRWPRHDTLLSALSVVKANRVKRPRDSRDDLDLATDVRLLYMQ